MEGIGEPDCEGDSGLGQEKEKFVRQYRCCHGPSARMQQEIPDNTSPHPAEHSVQLPSYKPPTSAHPAEHSVQRNYGSPPNPERPTGLMGQLLRDEVPVSAPISSYLQLGLSKYTRGNKNAGLELSN